jgi:multidrug efflux pump subunit AcrA (membrane-fusion protein)
VPEVSREELLTSATTLVTRLNNLVVTLASALTSDDSIRDDATRARLKAELAQAQTTLTGVLATLSQAQSALIAAQTTKDQAAIAGTGATISLADAQVKQALGALRLAQANLEKTIIRSPLAGVVGALTLRAGTSVNIGEPAAVITSDGGLEVLTYMTESDATRITVGDAAVVGTDIQGTVTEVGSAIDPLTQKIELRVGVSRDALGLTNGQSVTVRVSPKNASTSTEPTSLRLPITSIKMTPDGPVVFSVDDHNTLVSHAIVLGAIVSDSVVVLSGIDASLPIITDARGRKAGEIVTVQ